LSVNVENYICGIFLVQNALINHELSLSQLIMSLNQQNLI